MLNNCKSTHAKLFLLVLVFILPMIFSWLLYSFHDFFRFKTLNHGTFINPPLNVEKLLDVDVRQKLWKIVYFPAICDTETSKKMLYTLHQLKTALGKDTKRVSLLLVTNSHCDLKDIYDFQKVQKNPRDLQNLFSFDEKNKIYLMDPLGNLFMYYPDSVNPMHILKDVKHVLEVSQIG